MNHQPFVVTYQLELATKSLAVAHDYISAALTHLPNQGEETLVKQYVDALSDIAEAEQSVRQLMPQQEVTQPGAGDNQPCTPVPHATPPPATTPAMACAGDYCVKCGELAVECVDGIGYCDEHLPKGAD